MATKIARIELQGRNNDSNEWRVIKTFTQEAMYNFEAAKEAAEKECIEWWLNYNRMEFRVVIEK